MVVWSTSVTTIASATTVTISSSFGTPMARSRPATDAGTTPVSRVQPMKTISFRVHRPRRSGRRHASTVRGLATKRRTAITASAGSRFSAIVPSGRFAPSVMKTRSTTISAVSTANSSISSLRGLRDAEAEELGVARDQTGDERTEIAAPTRSVDGGIAGCDSKAHDDGGELAPDAEAALRDDQREQESKDDPEHGRDRELRDEVGDGTRPGLAAPEDERGDRQREHRAGGIVQRRLRDHRLHDLRPDPQALEEGDQDRGVGRGDDCADQESLFEGDIEDDRRRRSGHDCRDDDAGHGQEPEPDANPRENPKRELKSAVEEDERDAERQQELNADGSDRDVEPVEHLGTEQHARCEQENHARQAENVREHAGRKAGGQHDGQDLHDLLRGHCGTHCPRPSRTGVGKPVV